MGEFRWACGRQSAVTMREDLCSSVGADVGGAFCGHVPIGLAARFRCLAREAGAVMVQMGLFEKLHKTGYSTWSIMRCAKCCGSQLGYCSKVSDYFRK